MAKERTPPDLHEKAPFSDKLTGEDDERSISLSVEAAAIQAMREIEDGIARACRKIHLRSDIQRQLIRETSPAVQRALIRFSDVARQATLAWWLHDE